jgi:hypothetical protein
MVKQTHKRCLPNTGTVLIYVQLGYMKRTVTIMDGGWITKWELHSDELEAGVAHFET